MKSGATRIAKGTAGFAGAVLVWELLRRLSSVDARDFPSALDIANVAAASLAQQATLDAIGATLQAWAMGVGLAILIGIPLGIWLGRSRAAEHATRPIVEFIRPIPSVALIPLAVIWFGLGVGMKIFIIAFACTWPILFNAKAGVEGVDPRFIETGRAYGLSHLSVLLRIVLPAALPSMATGVRIAAAIGLALGITAEMIAGRSGLGFLLESSRIAGRATEVFATVLVAGCLGALLNSSLLALEKRVLRWSPDHRPAS